MVYIGNQTSCWAATPTEPFDYALGQAFDAFEWFPDKKPGVGWDEEDLAKSSRKAIAETARAREMRLSVHARWQANLLTPEGSTLFWKDFDLARDLGVALINIHLDHEQGVAEFIRAIVPLIQRTAQAGLQLSIENTPHHTPEHFNEFFARLRKLDSEQTDHVGMCLDLGHANLCAATRNDYLQFYDRLDATLPIIHLHLHENWGDSDSHLPLFTGPSARDDSGIRQLVGRLKKRGYSGSIILEQWPQPPSLLNNARDRLLELWQPAAKPHVQGSEGAPRATEQSVAKEPSETSLVSQLVEGDRTRRSWREKLDFVRELLAREDPAVTADQLIDVAIYLRFLGTGEIACSEDGRHFRPAHHARVASQIQDRLAKLATTENQFIVRRIYPWLPSSAQTFQRPEPLTRIRDIAHRNDIPQDLKREIKTTLQNKLHRCAGPEDLATSAALLERITAPGTNYSPDFVDQFKIFHQELKEFFNAQSLEQRLRAVAPLLKGRGADLAEQFLKQKAATVGRASSPTSCGGLPPRGMFDAGETPALLAGGDARATSHQAAAHELLRALRSLTELRRACLNIVAQKPGAETQAALLADIALEDFAFVLLSEIINASDRSDAESSTECQTEALTLALENLVLSDLEANESIAVQNELKTWPIIFNSADRNQLLRQRATLLRCRRLAEDFGDRMVELFSARAGKLGCALGVAEHAIRVFSEADIRSHIVFQISKLATGLLRQIRQSLKLPAWDVLVPGNVGGRATTIENFSGWSRDARELIVALLENAEGDEEIPKNVTGILLAHELPHLSHLAVRARQGRVVLVAYEESAEFDRLKSLQGQLIDLNATADKVEWKQVDSARAPEQHAGSTGTKLPLVRLAQQSRCIPLEQVTAENSGGKAAGARRLAELSHQPDAGFATPPALVIPFGVMEKALQTSPVAAEYTQIIKQLDSFSPAQIESAAGRLRALVRQLAVPKEIISEVQRKFGSPLIVRSSANCEDTEEFAGAGLYESIPNVSPSEVGSAIGKVWASLWTPRATFSRRETGIAHDQTHMAVLLEELLNPDFAFVLHTVNPSTRDPHSLYGEMVVGLGETLVSAAHAGEPYRFTCYKQSGSVEILAFANFSSAARPVVAGVSPAFTLGGTPNTSQYPQGAVNSPSPLVRGGGRGEVLYSETLDYSRINLSRDPAALESLAARLCKIGVLVEQALGKPQDIEGVVIQDKIYLVQTRPQQGL